MLRDPFDSTNTLTPKVREIVQDETKVVGGERKDRNFFEREMARSFQEGRRVLKNDGIGASYSCTRPLKDGRRYFQE